MRKSSKGPGSPQRPGRDFSMAARPTVPPPPDSISLKTPEERIEPAYNSCVEGMGVVLGHFFPEVTAPTDPPTMNLLRECVRIYTQSWVDHNVPKGPLSFKDWRARRKNRVASPGEQAHEAFTTEQVPVEVFEYPGGLYVQVLRDGKPSFHLVLGNSTVVDDDLSNLEGELYVHYRHQFD